MAEPEEPSFDPRTWARPTSSSAPPPSPSAPQSPAEPEAPPRRAVMAVFGAGLATAAVGGGALLLRRPPPRPAAAAPAGAKAAPPTPVHRSFVVPDLAALPAALAAAGVTADQAAAAGAALGPTLRGSPGELRVSARLEPQGVGLSLARLEARRADGAGAAVVRDPSGGFTAHPLATDVKVAVKAVRGEMDADSFYTSAVAAGVTDSLISPFAQAFAFDFDFQREIRPGDIFEAVFAHPVEADGRPAGGDRLLYAALQTAAKSRALYRFRPAAGGEGWFDANGRSIVRSLMRTPVEGARISSTFGMRFHPVLGFTRMHKGVDFAVVVGTPVYASGDGVIDFMGPFDGYGNFVKVRHNPTLETGYAHLSRFADGLKVGSPVRQGQQIAFSGNTGLSSGPHMHYEIIVKGEQVDPLTFQTDSGRNLSGADLLAFDKVRDGVDAQRAAQTG